MSQKTKLVAMISSFCFVIATCLFSVFAAKTFSFNMGGSIEFIAPGVNATVSAATLSGIATEQTGKMQTFFVEGDDTASEIAGNEGLQSWSGLQLMFTDDSDGQATIKFTITNDSEKDIENIMVELSTSTTSSSEIQATPSASFCITPKASHEFTIALSVTNPDISAKLDNFTITVALKAIKTSEISSTTEQEENGLTFSTNSSTKTASFAGYTGTATAVEIPTTVKDSDGNVYTITEIPDGTSTSSAFSSVKSTLTSVTFPSTLTKIGDYAFYGCEKLTGNLTIPNSVTTIGSGAFAMCHELTGELIIPNSVITIEGSAFEACFGFNKLTIGSRVTNIGASAFSQCWGFGTLTIPNSVTTIGDRAFEFCSGFTGDLIIPDSVTSMGVSVFYNCSGFNGTLIIGNSLTSISSSAFYSCSGLTALIIPNNIITIGDSAFFWCGGLTTVIIPNSVTTIGNHVFDACNITSMTIPNSVTSIGSYVFANCSKLTSITVESETPPTLGTECLYDVVSTCKIYVPPGSVDAYKTTENWSTYADRITAIV